MRTLPTTTLQRSTANCSQVLWEGSGKDTVVWKSERVGKFTFIAQEKWNFQQRKLKPNWTCATFWMNIFSESGKGCDAQQRGVLLRAQMCSGWGSFLSATLGCVGTFPTSLGYSQWEMENLSLHRDLQQDRISQNVCFNFEWKGEQDIHCAKHQVFFSKSHNHPGFTSDLFIKWMNVTWCNLKQPDVWTKMFLVLVAIWSCRLTSANIYDLDHIIRANFDGTPNSQLHTWFPYIKALLYHSMQEFLVVNKVLPYYCQPKVIGTFKYFSMKARLLGETQHIIGGRIVIKSQSVWNLNVHLLDR